MARQKNHIITRIITPLVMLMYLFIVVAYLFFTPKFQYRRSSAITKAKTNTQVIYTLIRTNRCMMNSGQSSNTLVKQHVAYAIPLKFGINELPFRPVEIGSALSMLIDRHSAYLHNRVLRI